MCLLLSDEKLIIVTTVFWLCVQVNVFLICYLCVEDVFCCLVNKRMRKEVLAALSTVAFERCLPAEEMDMPSLGLLDVRAKLDVHSPITLLDP